MVFIPKAMLDKILFWSANPFRNSQEIDMKLVRLLLVKLVGMASLAVHNVDENVKKFIKGMSIEKI